MEAKFLGFQPTGYGVLDGTATPAAMVGEVVGFGAVTDNGTGDWTIDLDQQVVGNPVLVTGGGIQIICSPFQRALAAGTNVTALTGILGGPIVNVVAWDLATPTAVDCITGLLIVRWPI